MTKAAAARAVVTAEVTTVGGATAVTLVVGATAGAEQAVAGAAEALTAGVRAEVARAVVAREVARAEDLMVVVAVLAACPQVFPVGRMGEAVRVAEKEEAASEAVRVGVAQAV